MHISPEEEGIPDRWDNESKQAHQITFIESQGRPSAFL